MRMRKKKNLEERLAACDNLMVIDREDLDFSKADSITEYINFTEYFGNENPVHLEIGCGKGQFVCEMAKRNPDINFIAVERSANVLVTACEKAASQGLENILFIKCTAEYLSSYLPENSIERLYLNFSCPFPKKQYASHRLTAQNFLKIYVKFLKKGEEIHFKTDNMQLFEFSVEQMSDFGFAFKNVTLDLHNSGFEGNIVTEYESRFIALGQPIYRLEAYLK